MLPAGTWSSTLGRVRLLRGSRELQTAQSQPITGTPVEVPLPRKVSFMPASWTQPGRAGNACERINPEVKQTRSVSERKMGVVLADAGLHGFFCVVHRNDRYSLHDPSRFSRLQFGAMLKKS
jgi:hypothetical protein